MAEYIERDKIVKWLRRVARLLKATENHKGKTKLIGQIIDHINKTSLADVVEVVRCKDCRHYHADTLSCDFTPHAKYYERPNWYEDDFCSYGERKDGADVKNT